MKNDKAVNVINAIKCLRDEGILIFTQDGSQMKAELRDIRTVAGFDNAQRPTLVCATQVSRSLGHGMQAQRFLRLESEAGYALAEEIVSERLLEPSAAAAD